MGAAVYRYQWLGVDVAQLALGISPGQPIVASAVAPNPLIDLATDNMFPKSDLDAAMLLLGWSYVSTDPSGPPQGIILRSVHEAVLAIDTATASAVFVDLLTLPVVNAQAPSSLKLTAAITSTALVTPNYFRLVVDGAPVPFSGFGHGALTGSQSIVRRVAVGAGLHSIALQWRVDLGGLADIRPVTQPDLEGASLLCEQYS